MQASLQAPPPPPYPNPARGSHAPEVSPEKDTPLSNRSLPGDCKTCLALFPLPPYPFGSMGLLGLQPPPAPWGGGVKFFPMREESVSKNGLHLISDVRFRFDLRSPFNDQGLIRLVIGDSVFEVWVQLWVDVAIDWATFD